MAASDKPEIEFETLIERWLPGALAAGADDDTVRREAARRQRLAVQAVLNHELAAFANRAEGAPGDGLKHVERLARVLRDLGEASSERREHRMEIVVTRTLPPPPAGAAALVPRARRTKHQQESFSLWRRGTMNSFPDELFTGPDGKFDHALHHAVTSEEQPLWQARAARGLPPWDGSVGGYDCMYDLCVAFDWPLPPGSPPRPIVPGRNDGAATAPSPPSPWETVGGD